MPALRTALALGFATLAAPSAAAPRALATSAQAVIDARWLRDSHALVALVQTAVTPSVRELFAAHDQTVSMAWSLDGATIAWCGREHTPGSSQFTLIAAKGGAPRTVLAGFPGGAEWLGFRPVGRRAHPPHRSQSARACAWRAGRGLPLPGRRPRVRARRPPARRAAPHRRVVWPLDSCR
jgi:hypothetical protein